ncbi:Methylenetetrahydrofolate dehydrogenase (NADP(+)) [Rhodopirellula maiorica SM1]|uniref:Methylenetetrahydrofolate dehydrogenase (NADP(+)) n=1 Tax=Rhodopirellula maiorica SM1 TaxID=1265738 RepID=M5RNH2_9BACT|nr:NADP-dependent methylenetetrahydromethanopterin/methylenetetrahydrofolate dehydrogenase [Rhodopirellula maiorica]EMI15534.1 Methylenetetrahydrofolate dehydrogenase (NADP(+)) [Rhodopirellula maiorica SM1]
MSRKILIQLDTDSHASTFDSVVAYDAGIDALLSHADVTPDNVTPLVHGAMFTRGGDDLKNTAIFIGGSDVRAAESLLKKVTDCFFGPVRNSVMLDANGCNTTAAAAVVYAAREVGLAGAKAVVMGATGPVGERVARLLAADGADVVVTSRSLDRANDVAKEINEQSEAGSVSGAAASDPSDVKTILADAKILIACGAAGVQLVDEATLKSSSSLKVAIDLNAVPPAGIEGIGVTDKSQSIGELKAYGAIGVGGLKMKTHRAAISSLFQSNDRVLDYREIYEIAKNI